MLVKQTLTLCVLICGLQLSSHAQEILLLKTTGKVVIGDTSQISTPTGYNLFVQNGILTEKVKVAVRTTSEWSDDAWDSTPTIEEVQSSIVQKRHLPDMPSAESLVQTGYDVQKMDAKLLAQVEWLWQHMIQLSAENKALREELLELKAEDKKRSDD